MDFTGDPESTQSPFGPLKVALESRTLESAKKLKNIEQDGSFTFAEERTEADDLNETLARIWTEYPEGLLDLTEANLEKKPLDEPAVDEEPEDGMDVDSKDPAGLMKWEDMVKLRESVGMQLNNARNELWFILELAKTLAASSSFPSNPPAPPVESTVTLSSSKKATKVKQAAKTEESTTPSVPGNGDAPIFPPGTMSMTPFRPSLPTHLEIIRDMELALAAKQSTLEQCEKLIDSAVDEFNKQASASQTFWRDIRQLKDGTDGRGQWAIVPKPDFSKILGITESARDVVIPYAIDEAPASARARCLAAFDLDPSVAEPMTFGARGGRVLQIKVTDSTGAMWTSSAGSSTKSSESLAEIQQAQIEAFDEDLYNEIRDDISRRPGASLDSSSCTLSYSDLRIAFEMVPAKKTNNVPEGHPIANLLLQSCRISLLNILRLRKRRLTSQAGSRPSSVLTSVLQVVRFMDTEQKARNVLTRTCRMLNRSGTEAKVVERNDLAHLNGGQRVNQLLQGDSDYSCIGNVLTLDISGCLGMSVTLSATAPLQVTTSQATFPLVDVNDLADVIAEDLVHQLLILIESALRRKVVAEHRSSVFLDVLEGAVVLPANRAIHVSVSPTFDALRVTLSEDSAVVESASDFDSDTGKTLFSWLDTVAAKV
ncbi:subunit 17 of mediator complex-domain-containing protein [Kockovaella imperatae]|uniref:Mediator of RNA polymerase II transcription subunit 17 n=1 Tax=Kockovaella imperatae TaxID=4999 RepID=A0A1Y1UAH4_9TREE|nr:subunit 17 of mediator complex-domain-containing protein [Kockovaella imperatae]ORX35038.1 subunit 17 of mediator complex-domain-containing protein [Kockovaella imperatae]